MRVAILVFALASLTGCESMVAPRYSVSGDNNIAVKALGVSGIALGEFSGPRSFDPNCRLLGALMTADGLTHTQYIRKAFEEEFKIGGIHAAGSPSVVLTGQVTHMDFSSTRGVTGGVWTIELTLTSSNGRRMKATETYEFESGFVAQTACKQTAEAFTPAVQNLVGKFVRSPEFASLVGATGSAARAGAPVSAQLTGAQRVDAAFWESVRASSNPADFRTYLEQFPNGLYAAAAQERLAALTSSSAPGPLAVVPLNASGGLPNRGDTWTYRLKESARAEGPRERRYQVTVSSASQSEIVERYTIENGPSGVRKHSSGAYLVRLGPSLFSPYLGAFQDLAAQPALGAVEPSDPMCGRVICDLKAKVVGREVVQVPAGSFEAIKVTVDQAWRGLRETQTVGGPAAGSRQLHIWYAPAVKRAVKFSSRLTGTRQSQVAGDFELELESYRLK